MAAMRPSVHRRPSRQNLMLAFGIALLAAVALVAIALFLRKDSTPSVVPNPVANLAGIPQNDAVLGAPTAKVALIEYADPQCPGCRYYALSVLPDLVREYIRPGTVKTEYRGYPFIGSDSVKALRFLLAAGLQNRLWQMQEALYRYQGRENDGWVTDDLVRNLAGNIDGLDVDKLFRDAESASITKEADEAGPAASAAGIPGTPTFFIQIGKAKPYALQIALDITQFRSALDDALAG